MKHPHTDQRSGKNSANRSQRGSRPNIPVTLAPIGSSSPITPQQISALILAGGRAQRMDGSDKGLVELRGQPMVCHVIDRLQPQLQMIRINANRNQSAYAALADDADRQQNAKRFEVIGDRLSDFQGPLAGIAAGLRECPTPWLLVVPCDTPFLPLDLVERLRLSAEQQQAEIAVASDGKQLQPVVALINSTLLPSLECYLASGERKIDRWYAAQRCCRVEFGDQPEAFLNINTLQQKQLLENQAV